VLFYVTPILYPADLLRKRNLGGIIDFNPAYHLIEIVRRPVLLGQPAASLSYVASGLTILLLVVAAVLVMHYYSRRIVFAL
jgi:ABC-type polysaccharide/polyol phosphate export permease